MRALALTFGDADCASTFYRILQYIEPLRSRGVIVEAFPARTFADWHSVADYDAVLVQKKLLPAGRVRWLGRRARCLIYDADDAVWEPHGRPHHWLTRWRTRLRARKISETATICVAANRILAGALRQWNSRVEILPMALNESIWPQKPAPAEGNCPVRIGWSGAPVNLAYLEAIEPALLAVQKRNPNARFAVFSGRKPAFRELVFDFLPFKPGTESEVIRNFDIGLLPLPEGKFSEAKSPIKGLQYMASGTPTVASPRGATRELFADGSGAQFAETESDWVKALDQLVRDPASRREMGRRARAQFLQAHSIATMAPRLAQLFQAAATSAPATP